jgi:hypothetical protein
MRTNRSLCNAQYLFADQNSRRSLLTSSSPPVVCAGRGCISRVMTYDTVKNVTIDSKDRLGNGEGTKALAA